VVSALITALESATSFGMANRIAGFLANNANGVVTREQVERIKMARSANPHIGGAFDVPGAIASLEAKLPKVTTSDYGFDEEPF